MTQYNIRRLIRAPITGMAILLFSAILALVLCGLEAANNAEIQHYTDTYQAIPIELTVTNLSASKSTELDIPMWLADLFTGKSRREPRLDSYISNLQMTSSCVVTSGDLEGYELTGITSIEIYNNLLPENGGLIQWKEGYDESVFLSGENVCLAPQNMNVDYDTSTDIQEIVLEFVVSDDTARVPKVITRTFTVVGTYVSGDSNTIYCPFSVMPKLFEECNQIQTVQSLRATLANNDDLDNLRRTAAQWFAEPNPLGTQTEWGEYGYDYYLFALDIDDDLFQNVTSTLERSMLINRICTLLIFVLSAGAGFFAGFLMVRSRKREVALMRTLGTTNGNIYGGFMLEQMLCLGLGILLGGSYFLFQPMVRLVAFVGVYFTGLSIAMLIFLNTNLLAAIKEDE